MADKKSGVPPKSEIIGEIIHYFGKIKVAIVKLNKGLKVGDAIRVIGGKGTDFKQKVKSMEIDYKKIQKAKPKDKIGLKLAKKAREGYKIYKISVDE